MTLRAQIVFESARFGAESVAGCVNGFLGAVERDPAVAGVALHRLQAACDRYLPAAGWLVELDIDDGRDLDQVLALPALAELLSELRQLRMHPRVHVLDAP
jgi:hypothetical protein